MGREGGRERGGKEEDTDTQTQTHTHTHTLSLSLSSHLYLSLFTLSHRRNTKGQERKAVLLGELHHQVVCLNRRSENETQPKHTHTNTHTHTCIRVSARALIRSTHSQHNQGLDLASKATGDVFDTHTHTHLRALEK